MEPNHRPREHRDDPPVGAAANAVEGRACVQSDPRVHRPKNANTARRGESGEREARPVAEAHGRHAIGMNMACALLSEGGVKCWGTEGFVGNGSSAGSAVPVPLPELSSGVRAIGAGGVAPRACALMTDGTAKCWGATPTNVVGF